MKILDNVYILFLSLFIVFSVTIIYYVWFYNPGDIVARDIRNNPEKYAEFVHSIEKQRSQILLGRATSFNALPEDVKEKLSELKYFSEPDHILIDRDSCSRVDIQMIEGRWSLEYNGCGNNELTGHDEDGFIETWTVNKFWLVIKDNDFI
jgi:hypothetical protein